MTADRNSAVEKQKNNPDVRPSAQNIPAKPEDFPGTPPRPRSFATGFSKAFLKDYHSGVMQYTYKGVPCLKSPIDLAIYMLAIWERKPGTIVEIGSFQGGAAHFYYDLTRNYGLSTDIITVDFRDIRSAGQETTGPVEFIQADALNLAESDLHERLKTAPRPWLVIEDSAHTFAVTHAVMMYFKDRMETGELLIIEDGVIEDQGGNWRYDGGPNRAVHEFFEQHPDVFGIVERYNDFFGKNVSFNPNGYLEKQ
ncbi:MAG: CmcI family methyltransferase [Pseudomonadota bacterium]